MAYYHLLDGNAYQTVQYSCQDMHFQTLACEQEKAAMHGIARGVIDTIQGGKFGAGFAGGFVSSGFAVSQKWGTVESRTIVMAVVGGTTSQ